MKKQLFLSLIAALMMTLGVNAQENTYNMVINMANGNTITIGPNEIDNIAFNDGAVVVSGTKIDDLMAAISANRNDIERNMSYIEKIFQKTDENRAIIEDHLHEFLKKIKGDVQILNPETGTPYTYSEWSSSAGTYLKKSATMEYMWNKIKDYQPMIEEINARCQYENNRQDEDIQTLTTYISALETRVRALEDRLANQ